MKTMRTAIMFIALAAISAESFAAMGLTDIRREARFLTDRMGYELGLSTRQYDDVYEINFDFLYHMNEVIDDVVYGYDDAIDYYYYLLDVRNEDLMYVLRSRQYRKFVRRDYFFRPVYMVGNTWGMRVWSRYTDRNYYYFGIPTCYHTYSGAHYRIHFAHSYYADIYTHKLYHGQYRLWVDCHTHHHHDGWHSNGMKKHYQPSSRPWSNAKNYEKSRKDLAAGYVTVSSRDASKRTVKIDSEASRRSALSTGASVRVTTGSREQAKDGAESRSTSGSRSRTSASADKSSEKVSVGSTVRRTTNSSSTAPSTSRGTSASDGGNNRSRSTSTVKSSSSSGSSRSTSTVKSGSSTSRSRASESSGSSASRSSEKSNGTGSGSSRSRSR